MMACPGTSRVAPPRRAAIATVAATVPASDALDAAARAQMQRWLDELYRWNARMNLTTVPPAQAWTRHVDEALELLGAATPPAGASVVDLGSGAGIPGIPMALARPDLRVTLVDSDQRKAAFLLHVTGLLGLGTRVRVAGVSAEALGRDAEHREAHDLVVSRATAPVAVLIELALPLLRSQGRLAALVRDAPADALAGAGAARLLGGDPPRAAGAGVLLVDKRTPVPDTYPRRQGMPRRRPLS